MSTLAPTPARPLIAWTGGSSPRKPSQMSSVEASFVKYLFRQQVATFRAYWKDAPNRDTLGIFWRRARGDAWASIREELQ